MTIVSRYLLRYLAVATLAVLVALTVAIWLTQSLRFLELTVNGGAPLSVFLKLVALTLPNFLSIAMPVALTATVLFTYNRLTLDSELVVLRAAGLSHWTLARPGLWLGLAVAVVVFFLNGWGAPVANRSLKALRAAAKTEYTTVLLKEGVFNALDNHRTIFIRKRLGGGEFEGVVYNDDSTPGHPLTIVAKHGSLVATEAGPRLVVRDGVYGEFNAATGAMRPTDFGQYGVDVKLGDAEIAPHWLEPSERTLPDLLAAMDDPDEGDHALEFFADLHNRLASPLFAFAMTMLGLATMVAGAYDRRGQARRIARGAIGVLLMEGIALGLTSLMRIQPATAPLIYFGALIPAAFAAWTIDRAQQGRPLPGLDALFARFHKAQVAA